MAFQGSLKELPLPDIVQLVSVSGKTGVFTLRDGNETGAIYLRKGQIVHAEAGGLSGETAVYALAIWRDGDFTFTPGQETEKTTIRKSNTSLLMEAARRIDEWAVLSKKIPSTRMVPVFTGQAVTTSVSMTPTEWAVVCKIDERRSIDEIAIGLANDAFEVSKTLYGLMTAGLISLKEDLGQLHTERLQGMSPAEIGQLAERIHRMTAQLLAGHERQAELDTVFRLSRAELEGGRGVDAVLDLVRAEEKVVSATLGPHQSRSYLDRVAQLLATA
jgi:hypothetical protein